MATRTISVAGGNFNATGTWDEGVVPVAGDAVVARGGGDSGQLTISAAAGGVGLLSFIMTNYTNTLTFNNTLTVAGTVTFVSGMTIAGTGGTLACTTTATLTSAGKTLTCALTLSGTATFTLGDNWTVNGTVTLGASTLTTTINSNQINCSGSLSIGGTTSTVTGTATLRMMGVGGTWSSTQTGAGSLRLSLNFDTGANSFVVSGTVRYQTGTITYTSGGYATSGSTLQLQAATTLNTTGLTWEGITSAASSTITLSSNLQWSGTLTHTLGATVYSGAFTLTGGDWTISGATTGTNTIGGTVSVGTLLLGNTTSTTFSGAFSITCTSCTISGTQTVNIVNDVSCAGTTTISDACVINGAFNWNTFGLTTTGALTGTTKIVFNGTGTWTGAAGALSNNVDINTAGTLTLSGTILFAASGTPTMTYVAGTVTQGTSILSIASSCTLDLDGCTFHDVTLTAALTLTLNGLMTIDGALTLPNAAVTFAGSSGFTVFRLTNTSYSATRITTFTAARVYTITGDFDNVGTTTAIKQTLTCASATSFILMAGASQDIGFCDPTNMNAAGGQTIFTYRGTITTSSNWSNTLPVNVLPPQGRVVQAASSW